MRYLPTSIRFYNDEHSTANPRASMQVKCHDRNRRSRKIDPQVLRVDVKKWRLADAGFGHSLARLIEDSLPCGVEFRGVVGPRASRAHVGGREKDNGILNPALAERGPIEILECGHEIRHELPHFRFRSGLTAKRSDEQKRLREINKCFSARTSSAHRREPSDAADNSTCSGGLQAPEILVRTNQSQIARDSTTRNC